MDVEVKGAYFVYKMEAIYYTIWIKTFEGDIRWHIGKFPYDTTEEQACEIVRNNFRGGVGGDTAEVINAELSHDDGTCYDYTQDY